MDLRYGKKLIEALKADELNPPVCLVTEEGQRERALASVKGSDAVAVVSGTDRDALDALAAKCPSGGTVLGFGGDDTMAAARYAAWKSGAALVLAPTAITGESLVRADVIVCGQGGRKIAGRKDADLLLVDYGMVWDGGEAASRSSVGHVLSIVTAVEDARRASAAGGGTFDEEKGLEAMDIVSALTDRSDDIYDLTEAGIRALVEALSRREEFAEREESRRLVEGSEHVFADCSESVLCRSIPRGPLLCLSVIMMLELQKMPSKPVKQFLYWIGAPWQPETLGVTEANLARVLGSLAAFESSGYEPTAIRGAELSGPEIKRILEGMKVPILHSSLQDRDD